MLIIWYIGALFPVIIKRCHFEKQLSHVEMEIWCPDVQLAALGDATEDLLIFPKYVSSSNPLGDIKFTKGGRLKLEAVSISIIYHFVKYALLHLRK